MFRGNRGCAGVGGRSEAAGVVKRHAALRRLPENFVTGSTQRASLTWAVTGVSPVAAMGSMSLTVYILHVLTAYWWQHNIALHSTLSALGFVVFFLVIAALWKHFLGKDPMERLVARIIDLAVPAGKKA